MGKNEAKARLIAEKRVYDDSPQVTVTYKDLSRFIENMLELVEDREVKGFNERKK